MTLDTLDIKGFRNIKDTTLQFSPQLTLIVGNNGQGKTNALEALYVTLTGTSFRGTSDQDLIGWNQPFTSLTAKIRKDHTDPLTITHFIGRQPVRKKHTGQIWPAVLFSPDDVQLSKGSPSGRRRFLDWTLATVDTRYLRLYRQYQHALLARNRILKDSRLWPTLPDFSHVLVESGLYLWIRRREMVQNIVPRAQEIFTQLTGLSMQCMLKEGGSSRKVETLEEYRTLMDERSTEEKQRQMTLVGPHRDDLLFQINGVAASPYASQGQHRALALSLKLASYHVLEKETGIMPIVLLDDVLSELDPIKRSSLLAFIATNHPQTIVTDTEARNFDHLHPQVYTVEDGQFSRQA
ncbi:DNA replication/repair protein RecF [Sulfobacillus sp. hq2]|uniref:DNA replication/repair protein RecF n=1 Tax=Sulfobacillus TaxID=28033 RepID=UPI000CD0C5FF|nr:DNA replication/repair protein RecF [Sulfobacillus sp. hq2]POB12063.1 DNA replication and repair protein RecF [Sulfobacillus sp. hq2]